MSTIVPKLLEKIVQKFGNKTAVSFKKDGKWVNHSWKQHQDEIYQVAKGLISLGFKPGQHVCILSHNRREWLVADLAAITAGGVPAGIYPTSSAEQSTWIAGHCKAAFLIVENLEQLNKVYDSAVALPDLLGFVLMEGQDNREKVWSWTKIIDLGSQDFQSELDNRISAQKVTDPATLVYTSGTTSNPKAVVLTHENLNWVSESVIGHHFEVTPEDVFISYLPLSHIAEQVTTIHGALVAGYSVSMAESIEKLGENLKEVRPTIFLGVPRVWEKIQAKMVEKGAANSPLKKKIVSWAKKTGLDYAYSAADGVEPGWAFKLADKIIYSKVREALGFDRCRFMITAAAPIGRSTLEFFFSLNIPVLEVYGMSETTGPATVSMPGKGYRIGKAGKAIHGSQLRIANDGELLVKGKHVFKEYLHDENATNHTIDSDGWLHTGDLGSIDENGFLTIEGRKKNLIITSGGENIATEMLENQFSGIAGVEHVFVAGDGEKFLSMLLTLEKETVLNQAKAIGSPKDRPEDLVNCEVFYKYIQGEVDRVNSGLARVQTIKKFKIIPENFSEETGELTPTMKVKRNVVYKKHMKTISGFYQQL